MRTLHFEKSEIAFKENFQSEFRKDFGANCKMALTPLISIHEVQMVNNWLFETETECFNKQQKIVRPSIIPTTDSCRRNFMIKMEPAIPVAKIQVMPIQEDICSLQQQCEDGHFIIRGVFNPKLQRTPVLYANAIRLACLYSFTHLKAVQVWMEVPSYQNSFINILDDAGFQFSAQFFAQISPISKFTLSLKDFKKREFFAF